MGVSVRPDTDTAGRRAERGQPPISTVTISLDILRILDG